MKPELSIIIPCYNCEKTLAEAVESCYVQGFKKDTFEIVIVDDGSHDTTRNVMAELAKKYTNIKIHYHEQNRGGGATRNTAVSKTEADIVFCLDSDDILPPETLPKMLQYMQTHECDGVLFEESRLFKDANHKKTEIVTNKITDRPIKLSDVISGKNGFLTRVNFLYKKSAYLMSGGYTTTHGFDTQSFGLRFLNKGLKVYVCPTTYYFHRLSSSSYFKREYDGGKFSLNTYLAYEDIFHVLSKQVKEEILRYDITNKSTGLDNLDQFIEKMIETLGTDDFFIKDHESFLTEDGESRLFDINKDSKDAVDQVTAGIYCLKRKRFAESASFFKKVLIEMPDSKIIQMNLMRAELYAKNPEGSEKEVFSKFVIKKNLGKILIHKIHTKIHTMINIKYSLKLKLGRSFWLATGRSMLRWFIYLPSFLRDYIEFKSKIKSDRFKISYKDSYPCLFDKTSTTGFDPHYLYHPAWAARIVAELKPSKHIDISSILHFSTLVSAFVPVEFYDYRPAKIFLPNLKTEAGDLLNIPFETNSVESLSCMHTIEHVGLGRYGDVIDPDSDLKAASELERVVKTGGTLIFVSPITGKPRIEFNAHRIYSYDQIEAMFPGMTIKEFSLIPDDFKKNGIIKNASKELANAQDWGCGLFHFIKK